jgi:hypothetical protein
VLAFTGLGVASAVAIYLLTIPVRVKSNETQGSADS